MGISDIQSNSKIYEMMWQDLCTAHVCLFTFDNNVAAHRTRGIHLRDVEGFKETFNIWSSMYEGLADDGEEVRCSCGSLVANSP